MTSFQKIVLFVLRLLLKTFVSWRVEGGENAPLSGPLVVIANHVHLLDPILLQINFPRWINFMAKEALFRSPILRLILRWSNAFAAHRQGTIKEKQQVLKNAQDILDRGLVLGMFPEGSRSPDGELRMGKSGSAVIASRANVDILPVGIAGTDKIKGISCLWRRPDIVINIGKASKLPSVDGRLNKSQRQLLTDSMMLKIAALLPYEYRGVYKEYGDHEN